MIFDVKIARITLDPDSNRADTVGIFYIVYLMLGSPAEPCYLNIILLFFRQTLEIR
jgi:hypothetical protein